MARLAVFDLDGTLVDSLDDLHASVNHALAAVGLPPRTRDEVHGFVGEGARVLLAKAVAPRDELLEPALAAWRPHYEAHCLDRTRPYPGIEALLAGAGRVARGPHEQARRDGAEDPRRPRASSPASPWWSAATRRRGSPIRPGSSRSWRASARRPPRPCSSATAAHDVQTARAAGVAMVAVTWGLSTRAATSSQAGATVFAERAADLARWVASDAATARRPWTAAELERRPGRSRKLAARARPVLPGSMIRLALKLALAAAALWAVWTFVPVRGRTLADRWRAAGEPRRLPRARLAPRRPARRASPRRSRRRARSRAAPQRPTEGHTDADRRAVERILAERLDAALIRRPRAGSRGVRARAVTRCGRAPTFAFLRLLRTRPPPCSGARARRVGGGHGGMGSPHGGDAVPRRRGRAEARRARPLYTEVRSPAPPPTVAGLPDLSKLAEGALPAVVGVITTAAAPPGAKDEALRELFDKLNDGPRRGIGSGFVVQRDGWVVTNAHVVEGAASIEVDLGSGQAPAREGGRRRRRVRRGAPQGGAGPSAPDRPARRLGPRARSPSGCSSSAARSASTTR